MQAIEKANQIITAVRVWKIRRVGNFKSNPIGHASILGALTGGPDRPFMVIKSPEARVWICLRHDYRRGAVPAANVGDLCSGFQLFFDAGE